MGERMHNLFPAKPVAQPESVELDPMTAQELAEAVLAVEVPEDIEDAELVELRAAQVAAQQLLAELNAADAAALAEENAKRQAALAEQQKKQALAEEVHRLRQAEERRITAIERERIAAIQEAYDAEVRPVLLKAALDAFAARPDSLEDPVGLARTVFSQRFPGIPVPDGELWDISGFRASVRLGGLMLSMDISPAGLMDGTLSILSNADPTQEGLPGGGAWLIGDLAAIGEQAKGYLNEMEKRGFDVR